MRQIVVLITRRGPSSNRLGSRQLLCLRGQLLQLDQERFALIIRGPGSESLPSKRAGSSAASMGSELKLLKTPAGSEGRCNTI